MSEKLPFDGLTEEERKKKRLEQWNRRMHDFDQLRNEYIWHMKQRDDFLDAVKNQKKRIGQLEAENAKLRKLLKHNGAIIEACTSEILDHIGVPYIVGPAGVAQALMEATAMLVHKRYDFDPPSFYKEDK